MFWSFFKLGLFTIGGGMAMIPLIQEIAVEKRGWLTEEECIDCIAVSQSLPGVVAINMATYIGYHLKKLPGSIVVTVGVNLPSYIIIILVVELLNGIGDSPYVLGALVGIKAAATGLIAFSAYRVGRQVLKDVFGWILAIVAFVVITFFGINAVFAILAGMAAGMIKTRAEAGKGGGSK